MNGLQNVDAKPMEVPIGRSNLRLGIGAECRFNTDCRPDTAANTRLKGALDEIRLFARALPPEQIQILARTNPVAAFTFEDGSTTVARDESGACNHGLIGSGIPNIPDRGGRVLSFEPAALSRHVAVNSTAELSPARAFTMSAWVSPASVGQRVVISKLQAGADGFELGLGSNGKPFVQIVTASGTTFRVDGTTSYPTGAWTRFAGTYDGKTLALYRGNTLEASSQVAGLAGLSVANGLPLTLGARPDGTQNFLGKLDDARIYRRALNAMEISTLP